MAQPTSEPFPPAQQDHQRELLSEPAQSAPALIQRQSHAPLPYSPQAPASASAPKLVSDNTEISRTPPPLPYTLRTRKLSISFFWFCFVCDSLVQPLVLYYCLWYLTDLSPNLGEPTPEDIVFRFSKPLYSHECRKIVFTIVTLMIGGVSIVEYFYRFFQLFRKGSKVRPLNARRSWVRVAPSTARLIIVIC